MTPVNDPGMRYLGGDKRVVFISYCHKDRRWVDRILIHFRPLERSGSLSIWEDSRIGVGTLWRADLEGALSAAAAAVLVISANYLASEFAMNDEVPALLRNAESRGTAVIPLIVGPSLFNASVLSRYQTINSPDAPLSGMSAVKRDEILVRLATSISSSLQRAAQIDRLSPNPGGHARVGGMNGR